MSRIIKRLTCLQNALLVASKGLSINISDNQKAIKGHSNSSRQNGFWEDVNEKKRHSVNQMWGKLDPRLERVLGHKT